MAGAPDTGSPPRDAGAVDPARVGRWRRRTTAIFWGATAVFAISSSIQVGLQLFSPSSPSDPPASCSEGVKLLQASLDAGWSAARRQDDGPEHALGRFRTELGPTWRHLPWLQRACSADPERSARLDALERLRYALESRVRVDGGSLAVLRQRALGVSLDGSHSRGAAGDPTGPPDEEGPELEPSAP